MAKLDAGGGIEVHWCQSCHGTWHDKGILDEFTRLSGLPELLQEKPAFSHPSDRRCPRCEVPMEKSGLGAVKFLVDRCRSCQGLWLDHGELAKLGQLAEAEPPPAMTCPRCQSVLEEHPVPEGIVALVCRHCWGAWYDNGELLFLLRRRRDLKGLLDHPLLQQKLSKARCPRCQGILGEGDPGPGKLRAERCRNCGGVWLDAAEKAKLDEIVGRRRPAASRRTAGTTDSLMVYYSRTKLAFLALGALSLVVVGVLMVLFRGDWADATWGVLTVAFFGSCLLYLLYRLCWRQPALVVTREGIIDNTSPFGAGMVTWADIASVLVGDPQRHGRLILWIPQRNPKAKLITISIPQTTLPTSPGAFVLEMRRYCPDTVRIHWKPGVPA